MKKRNILKLFLLLLIPVFVLISCGEDDGPAAPDLAISVDPTISESVPGGTVEFEIIVAGDLDELTLNNNQIKSFTAGTFNDTITYSYTFPADATTDQQITFTVVAVNGDTKNANAQVNYVMPDYALADFSVLKADTATWNDWWEGEDFGKYPGAAYDGGDASSAMYATSRGNFADSNWDFEADLPDGGKGLMMTRLSLREDDGGTAWDGYMIPVFGWYGPDMSQPSSDELGMVSNGQRVIAIDVYYETDANSPQSFSDLSVDGKGVKFQLRLGNHAKYKASGDKKGWFIIKEAFVAEPDTWTTLYFSSNDDAEINAEDDEGNKILSLDATAGEVNFAWFVPAYGAAEWDSNKIYLKNLRITNPAEE